MEGRGKRRDGETLSCDAVLSRSSAAPTGRSKDRMAIRAVARWGVYQSRGVTEGGHHPSSPGNPQGRLMMRGCLLGRMPRSWGTCAKEDSEWPSASEPRDFEKLIHSLSFSIDDWVILMPTSQLFLLGKHGNLPRLVCELWWARELI